MERSWSAQSLGRCVTDRFVDQRQPVDALPSRVRLRKLAPARNLDGGWRVNDRSDLFDFIGNVVFRAPSVTS